MNISNLLKRVSVITSVSLATVVAAWAAGAFNVTATIYNYNGTTPYALQSDGSSSATYSGNLSPSTNVVPSYMQLNLALTNSRSVVLTLSPLDSNSKAAAPFSSATLPGATVRSRCFTPSGASSYQDWTQIQPATPDGNCSMRVLFTYNGVNYILVSSPEYPGTGTATVTCTKWSTSAKSCVAWTDVPNASSPNPTVAFLLNASNGDSYVGSYSLTFNLAVTHP